jgi:hypothetical protein
MKAGPDFLSLLRTAGHTAPAPLALRPGALLLGSPRTLPESGAMGFPWCHTYPARAIRSLCPAGGLL